MGQMPVKTLPSLVLRTWSVRHILIKLRSPLFTTKKDLALTLRGIPDHDPRPLSSLPDHSRLADHSEPASWRVHTARNRDREWDREQDQDQRVSIYYVFTVSHYTETETGT